MAVPSIGGLEFSYRNRSVFAGVPAKDPLNPFRPGHLGHRQ